MGQSSHRGAELQEKINPDDSVHIEKSSIQADADGFDPVTEKKLLRKLDLHLIPVLSVLLLCAFVDR